jgi:DNA-binding transcriptional MerR regulator/effector-binding domain-containing protein
MDLFSIGEFSRMSGLPVRTLRFYHKQRVLIPERVEADTGYRYYSHRDLENARVISALRALDFGLETITAILGERRDDGDILEFLARQRDQLQSEIEHRSDIVQTLDSIITQETNARLCMHASTHEIERKTLAPLLVGGIRMRGRYSDCSKAFGKLGRKLGRHIGGKAMMLCYDDEYREDDADFEPCMPLKRAIEAAEVHVRELPGGPCLALVHAGPYDGLTRSYAHLLEYAKAQGLTLESTSREIYLKGPGMIFKGNPQNYLTEIQFLVSE